MSMWIVKPYKTMKNFKRVATISGRRVLLKAWCRAVRSERRCMKDKQGGR